MTLSAGGPSLRFRLSSPEKFLLATLIPLGILTTFVIPLGAGHDEESQMARVWEMSALYFVPNEKLGTPGFPYPMLLREVSYRRQVLIRPVPPDFWSQFAGLPIDGKDYYYGPVETRIVYSPPLLLPQALVMRYLGRKFDLPFLDVYYATRLAGLLVYLVLAWLAVRLIPFGKWTMAILVVSPLALFQASTVTADAISNGLGVSFIGGCLAVCLRGDELRWRDLLALLLLVAALFLAKVNLIGLAVLPFVLLRPSNFRHRSGYFILAAGVLFLLVVEVGGWSLIAYPRVRTAMMEGADPVGQLRHILGGPLRFLALVGNDLWQNGLAYLRSWIAGYGYNYWTVPAPTFAFFLLAVLASLFVQSPSGAPSRQTRLALGATFGAAYLVTALAFYVAFSPTSAPAISGMHGRYLFATVVPLFLALVGISVGLRLPWSRLAAWGAALSLVFFIGGALLSYYVPCGTQVYQPGLCYQPYYKNWAPTEQSWPTVDETTELIQEILPECAGMTEVRVWMRASGADPGGATSFLLRDPSRDEDLVAITVPNADLPQDGWQTFRLAPQPESEGHLYLLRIHGQGPGGRVAYTAVPENPSVKLFVDGVESDVDLFFQYGCLTGLGAIVPPTLR